MAEETKDPVRNFPRMMLTGLGITGVIYVLVAIFAVALVPVGELGEGDTPLTKVVSAGLPDFPIDKVMPFISMFAVANSALINMLMASRLLYGMASQDVLPPGAGLGAQGPAHAVGRDHLHHGDRLRPDLLRQHQRQRICRRWAAPRPCCCSASSPSSTSRCSCCAATRSTATTS